MRNDFCVDISTKKSDAHEEKFFSVDQKLIKIGVINDSGNEEIGIDVEKILSKRIASFLTKV